MRSYHRSVYFGPPAFLVLNVVFCFAFQRGTNIGFWTLYIPLTILSTVYCILLPQKAIRRYKNIIQTLEFRSESEMILTLIDGRTLTLSKPELKDSLFKVGNAVKTCKLISDNSGKYDYTIIPEFFTHPPIL